jgi:hypothetical protein
VQAIAIDMDQAYLALCPVKKDDSGFDERRIKYLKA